MNILPRTDSAIAESINAIPVLLDTLPVTSEKLSKRAERKAVTKGQNKHLLALNSVLHKQYERTAQCAETIYLHEHTATGAQKVSTNYCGKRWCTVCAANKTAELMNGYSEPLKRLPDLHLLTLTVPSVTGEYLHATIKQMQSTFTKLKDSLRKKNIIISGIRKLECNFNPEEKTFNPHFHLVISGRIQSVEIIDQWLIRNPTAFSGAQNVKVADDDTLMELFKYVSKSIVSSEFDAIAQDTIYRAFVGIRAFQNFGLLKKCPTNDSNSLDDIDSDNDDTELPVVDTKTINGCYRIISSYYWNPFHLNWINSDGVSLHYTNIRPKVHELIKAVERV